MDNYQSKKTKEALPPGEAPSRTKTEQEKLLASCMEIWAVYVLRTFSDKEHPLSKSQVTALITTLTGLGEKQLSEGGRNPIAKTVDRRLQDMEYMGRLLDSKLEKNSFGEAFYRVIGGRVVAAEGTPIKYYFEPILNEGDVTLVNAAIESNHYLSPEEKEYLVSRESAACSYSFSEEEDHPAVRPLHLKKRPQTSGLLSLPPSRSPVTLEKISTLQHAIRNKLKISIVPGTYFMEGGHIVFGPKRDKENILNPYALLCQNGQYYIVVTHEGHNNPTHYRVDRLYQVSIAKETEGRRAGKPKKRDEIPTKLQDYFKKNRFLSEEYTSKYPLMAYCEKEGIKKCEFLCQKSALSIAIDYFGVGDTVRLEEDTEADDRIKVSVLADYENVRIFCIQQHMVVTPLFPEELVSDVRASLLEAVERLDKFVQ